MILALSVMGIFGCICGYFVALKRKSERGELEKKQEAAKKLSEQMRIEIENAIEEVKSAKEEYNSVYDAYRRTYGNKPDDNGKGG